MIVQRDKEKRSKNQNYLTLSELNGPFGVIEGHFSITFQLRNVSTILMQGCSHIQKLLEVAVV